MKISYEIIKTWGPLGYLNDTAFCKGQLRVSLVVQFENMQNGSAALKLVLTVLVTN